MGRRTVLALPWIGAALALALFATWLGSNERNRSLPRATFDVAAVLSDAGAEAYTRADRAREFEFPKDHGPHDGFQTEWWYFTGNLQTAAGRRFGYQLTFFRSALTPRPVARASTFAADHAWMAHFTLSDVEREEFHSFERFARESAGIAGADGGPLRVWLRDWRCEFDAAGAPLRLLAREGTLAMDLQLAVRKPPVLNGDGGLSQKDSAAGAASYYYSMTRLDTSGRIESAGETSIVEGSSWMDREWMSTALGEQQIGWDWFALQLDDGSELMWYRLRRADGRLDPCNAGTFVAADGSARALLAGDLELAEYGKWKSPRSQAEYPARWKLAAAALDLELEVTPALADQELDVSFRYWEGAVDVRGRHAGRELLGRGYVELVGYGEQKPGERQRPAR